MRARSTLLFSAALAAASLLPAQAQLLVPQSTVRVAAGGGEKKAERRPATPAEKEARAFRKPQVRGRSLLRAVSKVTRELDWHKSLDSAFEASEESGKPVVWFQALGDLRGYV